MPLATPSLTDNTIRHLMQMGLLDPTTGEVEIAAVAGLTEVVDTRVVTLTAFGPGTNTATGNGAAFYRVPATMNGWRVAAVAACVATAGVTGLLTVQLRRVRAGVSQNILTTSITIDTTEVDSSTGATAAVIDTASGHDLVETGDQVYVDVTTIHSGTAAKGLLVEVKLQAE